MSYYSIAVSKDSLGSKATNGKIYFSIEGVYRNKFVDGNRQEIRIGTEASINEKIFVRYGVTLANAEFDHSLGCGVAMKKHVGLDFYYSTDQTNRFFSSGIAVSVFNLF